MKTSLDLDQIVYDLLSASEIKTAITGGIYFQDDRPDGSLLEDVTINTITTTQDSLPQIATSNVNIYVGDKLRRIDKTEQWKPDHKRLGTLAKVVVDVLRASDIEGVKLIIESQSILQEVSVKQHFCNIRIGWNIHVE